MSFTDSAGSKSIDQREHNENASAKRVVSYYQNEDGDWVQVGVPLVPGVDYDYIDVQQTDADTETYVFKTGGSGGTTVRTIVINYTDSTKANLDNVAWS